MNPDKKSNPVLGGRPLTLEADLRAALARIRAREWALYPCPRVGAGLPAINGSMWKCHYRGQARSYGGRRI